MKFVWQAILIAFCSSVVLAAEPKPAEERPPAPIEDLQIEWDKATPISEPEYIWNTPEFKSISRKHWKPYVVYGGEKPLIPWDKE
ncbi:MAG TPA: hypothetical protein VMJ66_10410 [Geobacteraceae bacterium]|nr:hypothetical protein [Geobacteraceae bacterium]